MHVTMDLWLLDKSESECSISLEHAHDHVGGGL